jgi:hypothetical protein
MPALPRGLTHALISRREWSDRAAQTIQVSHPSTSDHAVASRNSGPAPGTPAAVPAETRGDAASQARALTAAAPPQRWSPPWRGVEAPSTARRTVHLMATQLDRLGADTSWVLYDRDGVPLNPSSILRQAT